MRKVNKKNEKVNKKSERVNKKRKINIRSI